MYRFFVSPDQIEKDQIIIVGSDVNHMKNVLRFKSGEKVMVCDGLGTEYLCTVEAYEQEKAVLKILNAVEGSVELPVAIHLYQGLPKKDKLELVIQKAVELGAASVTPVMMNRSVVRLDEKGKDKKTVRWQAIADAAAKQAKRGEIPKINRPAKLKALESALKDLDLIIVPYENAKDMAYTREILSEVKNYDKIGVIIGPEGGFDPEEVQYLTALGAKVISLGKRILRTETAGLALLSYLMIDMEEVKDVCKNTDC